MREEGFYYLESPKETRPTLVYYYENPDTQKWGFGFNIVDGGGFLPEGDLTEDTIVIPVEIVRSDRDV